MDKVIGVIGGMGPYAGIELEKRILDCTLAKMDQEHISLIHISFPDQIVDRTSFLLGHAAVNPGYKIAEMILRAEKIGAEIIAIACNTSHAPEIYDIILSELRRQGSKATLLNMIDETLSYLKESIPDQSIVGVLSTNGIYLSNLYHDALQKSGYRVVIADTTFQKNVIHRAIYDPIIGLKAQFNPVSSEAISLIQESIEYFKERGVNTLILGCTEFSFGTKQIPCDKMIVIDPTDILARSIVQLASPEKLVQDHVLKTVIA